MKRIGPSFGRELQSAGLLGLPFSWADDGAISFTEGMTEEQKSSVLAVYAAHNPAAPAPPPMPIEQIRAIESTPTVADAMMRANRLVALAYSIDELIRVAAAKGQTVTREQAHAWAIVHDSNYRTLYETEQVIKPLRALV